MDLLKKISKVQIKLKQTEELTDDLLLSLKSKENKVQNHEQKILTLKDEIKKNIEKIDMIIKNYNANS